MRFQRPITSLLSAALAISAAAARVESQELRLTPDSILVLLASPQWPDRHVGLVAIHSLDTVPVAVIARLRLVVAEEARVYVERARVAASNDDEGYGEYIMALAIVLGRVQDPSTAADIVRIDGLQVSYAVQLFVAAQGAAVLPVLDSVFSSGGDGPSVVLETWAMMIARSRERLNDQEYTDLLARVLNGAIHPDFTVRFAFLGVARQAPLPVFWPAVSRIATSDPHRTVTGVADMQLEAQPIAALLAPLWNALTPSVLAAEATSLLTGACASATGATQGHCTAAKAQWATVQRHRVENREQPLRAALAAFRQSVTAAAASPGGLSEACTTVLLAVADRLQP